MIDEYNLVLKQEKVFGYQKSRIQWLKFRGRSTRFFKLSTLAWRKHNKIERLQLSDGSWTSDPMLLKQEVMIFYPQLLGKKVNDLR